MTLGPSQQSQATRNRREVSITFGKGLTLAAVVNFSFGLVPPKGSGINLVDDS